MRIASEEAQGVEKHVCLYIYSEYTACSSSIATASTEDGKQVLYLWEVTILEDR